MINRILIVCGLILFVIPVSAQYSKSTEQIENISVSDSSFSGLNQLTIYVIPSKVKYDWTSPSTLYKSFVKNYKRNLFSKDNYILGHAFMELKTEKLSEKILTGMRSSSRKEQKELLLKEGYGLSILGADLEGFLENSAVLEQTKKKFSRKGRLAFMTFYISDEATDRMISFFQSYQTGIDSMGSSGGHYGGAFWPRYNGEGSGCSAFVVSFLDLAGLLIEEFDEWMVGVNIPMDLIGGPYNDNNDVRLRDIRRCNSWADDTGPEMKTAEYIQLYDPYLIYEWINEKWETDNIKDGIIATPLLLNASRGIRIDGRNQSLPEDDHIFMDREEPSIFIDSYHEKDELGK